MRKVTGGTLRDTLCVWGNIGFGIKGLDYMDGTHNKYGIYEIELLVDDSLRFLSRMDNFSYSENRLINAWTDYERFATGEGWFLRSFLLENNPLRALVADDARGWVCIDEERLYRVEYRLRDYHGNAGGVKFVVRGKKNEIPPCNISGKRLLKWYLTNKITFGGLLLDIPRGALFENTFLDVAVDGTASPVYRLSDTPQPLWHAATLTLPVPEALQPFAEKCYIERVPGGSAGGMVSGGNISADIYVLDRYRVALDTLPPLLRAIDEKQWERNGKIVFSLADKQTGISSFKGFLDGQFVLFEYSSKDKRLVCDMHRERVSRGNHMLRVVAIDGAGNETVYEKNIKY